MTAATYQSTTVTDFGSDATAHLANMPATVDSGDLLLALAAFDASATITTPSGWTKLAGGIRTDMATGVYAKVADGSEDGATVDFVTSAAQRGSVHALRFSNWEGTLSAGLRLAYVSEDSVNSAIALGLGASADVHWVVAQMKSSATAWNAGPPSGYSNNTKTNASEDTTASASIASATRTNAAADETVAALWNDLNSEGFLVAVMPVPPTVVTPATATLATATFAPTVTATQNAYPTPGVASLTTARFAPTVTSSGATEVIPGTASLTTARFAPQLRLVVTPGVAAALLTAYAPEARIPIFLTLPLLEPVTFYPPEIEIAPRLLPTLYPVTFFPPTLTVGAEVVAEETPLGILVPILEAYIDGGWRALNEWFDSDSSLTWKRGVGADRVMQIGTLEFDLNNSSRRFTPQNRSSPWFNKIRPGVPVRYSIGVVSNTALDSIDGAIDADDDEISDAGTGFSGITAGRILVIDPDEPNAEIVLVTNAAAGTTLTIARGYLGSEAQGHADGADVRELLVYPRFTGILTDPQAATAPTDDDNRATFSCEGTMARLRAANDTGLPLGTFDITVPDALALVCDANGITFVSETTDSDPYDVAIELPIFALRPNANNAMDIALSLVRCSLGGFAYENGSGEFVLRSRAHMSGGYSNPTRTTSVHQNPDHEWGEGTAIHPEGDVATEYRWQSQVAGRGVAPEWMVDAIDLITWADGLSSALADSTTGQTRIPAYGYHTITGEFTAYWYIGAVNQEVLWDTEAGLPTSSFETRSRMVAIDQTELDTPGAGSYVELTMIPDNDGNEITVQGRRFSFTVFNQTGAVAYLASWSITGTGYTIRSEWHTGSYAQPGREQDDSNRAILFEKAIPNALFSSAETETRELPFLPATPDVYRHAYAWHRAGRILTYWPVLEFVWHNDEIARAMAATELGQLVRYREPMGRGVDDWYRIVGIEEGVDADNLPVTTITLAPSFELGLTGHGGYYTRFGSTYLEPYGLDSSPAQFELTGLSWTMTAGKARRNAGSLRTPPSIDLTGSYGDMAVMLTLRNLHSGAAFFSSDTYADPPYNTYAQGIGGGIRYAAGDGFLFLANPASSKIVVFDESTNTLIASCPYTFDDTCELMAIIQADRLRIWADLLPEPVLDVAVAIDYDLGAALYDYAYDAFADSDLRAYISDFAAFAV